MTISSSVSDTAAELLASASANTAVAHSVSFGVIGFMSEIGTKSGDVVGTVMSPAPPPTSDIGAVVCVTFAQSATFVAQSAISQDINIRRINFGFVCSPYNRIPAILIGVAIAVV